MSIHKDIQQAYAEVLDKMTQEWVFNCDSGCFSEVCDRHAWTTGSDENSKTILVIYQPHKSMREYDDMFATIFIKRIDKKKFTASDLKKASLDDLHTLVLESYNAVLEKSNNKWTHPIDGTIEQLLQIKKPLHVEDGAIKMTFEIRGAYKWCCGDSWAPHKLLQYLGNTDATVSDDPDFYERLTEEAKPATL